MITSQTLIAIAICGITMILLISTIKEILKSRKANKAPSITFSYDDKKIDPVSTDDSVYIDLYGYPFKVRSDIKMIDCAGMLKTFIFKNDLDMKYIVRLLKKHEKAIFVSFQSAKVYFVSYDYNEHKWVIDLLDDKFDIKKVYSKPISRVKRKRKIKDDEPTSQYYTVKDISTDKLDL